MARARSDGVALGPVTLGMSLVSRLLAWQDHAGHLAAVAGSGIAAALHLDSAGRWIIACAAVALAWLLGRIGSDILAATFRILLIGVAVICAFEVLRAGA